MSLLEAALDCARRGWFVCPCNGKVTAFEGGYKDASLDPEIVREWWTRNPNFNPGLAPGKSQITVVDIDTGLTDEDSLREFMRARSIPHTFAVRTGKRPDYRVQLYFAGCGGDSFNRWKDEAYGGDLRATWGHVMAPGSIHPESKQPYEILWDVPLAPVPAWVQGLRAQKVERKVDIHAPIIEWRNDTLFRVLCAHRAHGADDEMVRGFALRKQAEMPNPLDEDELERIIQNVCKLPIGPVAEEVGSVTIGGSKHAKEQPPPIDPWAKYHTAAQILDAPPVTFLIDGFLTEDAITVIAAPVAQRKSIIALNAVHSLVTGEPLFEHFE